MRSSSQGRCCRSRCEAGVRRSCWERCRPPRASIPVGPDRGGPHGLLPPLQRETLAYDRPYEAGLAWTFNGIEPAASLLARVAAPQHSRASRTVRRRNAHVVSRGRFSDDSAATPRRARGRAAPCIGRRRGQCGGCAPAPIFGGTIAQAYTAMLEAVRAGLTLRARSKPPRTQSRRRRVLWSRFRRASGWRGHVIFWRGRNFIKEEGDPNYLSLTRGGDRYRGTRDYAEAGLTRRFTLARAAVLDVSGRLHRVEGRYRVLVPDRERRFGGWKIR